MPLQRDIAPVLLAGGDEMLAALEETTQPAMRWYTVNSPACILGRGQPFEHVDADACEEVGIAVHRRASGGTAVLMNSHLLMLDVAIPIAHRLYLADVTESYRWYGDLWSATLQSLGLQTHVLSPSEARQDTQHLDTLTRRVCFGGRSPYEVVTGDGRKIVGLAQVRRRGGALIQAGIYFQWESQHIVDLLHLEPDERQQLTTQLEQRITSIATASAMQNIVPPITFDDVMVAFEDELCRTQGVRLEDSG